MIGSLPDNVDVLIAPAYGAVQPSTIPSGAWVSIKSYVTDLNWHRGNSEALQAPVAGTLTIKADNYDGKLTPNTGGWSNPSTIVPHGTLLMPIRVTIAEGGVTTNRFTGWVEDWGPTRLATSTFLNFEIQASDSLALGEYAYLPPTYLGIQYMTKSCAFWYPMTDVTTTTILNPGDSTRGTVQNFQCADASGNQRDGRFGQVSGQYVTSVAHKQAPKPVLNLQANTVHCNQYSKTVMAGSAWWFAAKVAPTNDGKVVQTAKPQLVASVGNGGGGWALTIQYESSSKSWYPRFTTYNSSGAQVGNILGSTPYDIKDKEQLVVLSLSGGTFSLYLNGVLQGTCSSAGMYLPNATLILLGASGPGSGVTYAPFYGRMGTVGLGATSLTQSDVTTWWDFVYPLPRKTGEWIGLQLDALGAPGLDRALDAGTEYVIEPDAKDFENTTVRSALQQTTQEEVGQLWVDGSGAFRFYDRSHLINSATVGVTFGTAPGSIPVVEADIRNSLLDLYTAAQGSRGSNNPIIVDSAAETTIAGRTGGYGVRTYRLPVTVNFSSNAAVRRLLNWLVAKQNKELTRVPRIVVKPWVNVNGTSAPNVAGILALDVWSNTEVIVVDRPGGTSTLTAPLIIQGVTEHIDFTTREWTIEFECTPAWNKLTFFIPDGTQSIDGAELAP